MAAVTRRWPVVPTAIDHMWAMGGKICDLPGHLLDHLAAQAAFVERRPWDIRRAQEQLDAYAERYPSARQLRSEAAQ